MLKNYKRYHATFKFACRMKNIIYIQHFMVPQKINRGTINPKAFLLLLGHRALFIEFQKVTPLFPLNMVCLSLVYKSFHSFWKDSSELCGWGNQLGVSTLLPPNPPSHWHSHIRKYKMWVLWGRQNQASGNSLLLPHPIWIAPLAHGTESGIPELRFKLWVPPSPST